LSIIIGDSHQAIESEPRPADHAGHGYKQRHFCSRVPILLVSTWAGQTYRRLTCAQQYCAMPICSRRTCAAH